jgi:hypothetical protein
MMKITPTRIKIYTEFHDELETQVYTIFNKYRTIVTRWSMTDQNRHY